MMMTLEVKLETYIQTTKLEIVYLCDIELLILKNE